MSGTIQIRFAMEVWSITFQSLLIGPTVFKLYIKFDFPPDPTVARKVLARICIENNALHYTVSVPLNFEEPVKLPYEQSEAGLDICLARIRENTPKIIAEVAEGLDLWVETL